MEEYFSKMKITLIYNDTSIEIAAERNKIISYIKSQAYILFNIKGKFTLFYKNRDLTPYYEKEIGSYFKNLRHAHILIKDKTSSLQLSKSLPHLKVYNQQAEYLTQSKRALTKCINCNNVKINYFCRDCGVFLCKYCRMIKNGKHYSHRTVTLYPEDLNKSANLYKEVVNGDLYEAINSRSQMEAIQKSDLDIEKLASQLKSKLFTLFAEIEKIQRKAIDISNYENNKDKYIKEINDAIADINEKSDIKEESLIDAFDKLNQKDKSLELYSSLPSKLEQWETINNNVEDSLKSLERTIYNALSETLNEKIDDSDYRALQDYINYYYQSGSINTSLSNINIVQKKSSLYYFRGNKM